MSHVNLLTINQINFTKGVVIRKHLVEKKNTKNNKSICFEKNDASDDEEDDYQILNNDKKQNKNSLKKKKISYQKNKNHFLQYEIQFHKINPKNFSSESLGGLDINLLPWTI